MIGPGSKKMGGAGIKAGHPPTPMAGSGLGAPKGGLASHMGAPPMAPKVANVRSPGIGAGPMSPAPGGGLGAPPPPAGPPSPPPGGMGGGAFPSGGARTTVGSALCDEQSPNTWTLTSGPVDYAATADMGVTVQPTADQLKAAFTADIFPDQYGNLHGGFDLGEPLVLELRVDAAGERHIDDTGSQKSVGEGQRLLR